MSCYIIRVHRYGLFEDDIAAVNRGGILRLPEQRVDRQCDGVRSRWGHGGVSQSATDEGRGTAGYCSAAWNYPPQPRQLRKVWLYKFVKNILSLLSFGWKIQLALKRYHIWAQRHTPNRLMAHCLGLPGWVSTRRHLGWNAWKWSI